MKNQGWPFALAAVLIAQMGTVVSRMVMEYLSPQTTAWTRTTIAMVIMFVIVRPSLRGLKARDWLLIVCLGVASMLMSIFFLAGIAYIPLGMAMSIEYLGPLTVAAASAKSKWSIFWLGVALTGVVLVTEPWQGTADVRGVLLILVAGALWATYIVLNQAAGDRFEGPRGIALSLPFASLAGSFVGIPGGITDMTWPVFAACILLGFLNPGLPFLCESVALRRMNRTAFGTLLALAPAVAAVLALIFINETLTPFQWGGVLIVVLAGIFSQRDSGRDTSASDTVKAALAAERANDPLTRVS